MILVRSQAPIQLDYGSIGLTLEGGELPSQLQHTEGTPAEPLEAQAGLEPTKIPVLQTGPLAAWVLRRNLHLLEDENAEALQVRVEGIEPSSAGWKPAILPLNDTRLCPVVGGLPRQKSELTRRRKLYFSQLRRSLCVFCTDRNWLRIHV